MYGVVLQLAAYLPRSIIELPPLHQHAKLHTEFVKACSSFLLELRNLPLELYDSKGLLVRRVLPITLPDDLREKPNT